MQPNEASAEFGGLHFIKVFIGHIEIFYVLCFPYYGINNQLLEANSKADLKLKNWWMSNHCSVTN